MSHEEVHAVVETVPKVGPRYLLKTHQFPMIINTSLMVLMTPSKDVTHKSSRVVGIVITMGVLVFLI